MTKKPATVDLLALLADILEESTPLLDDPDYMRGQKDAFKMFLSNPYFQDRNLEGLKNYLIIFSLNDEDERDPNFSRAYILGLNSALLQLLGMVTYLDPLVAMMPDGFAD